MRHPGSSRRLLGVEPEELKPDLLMGRFVVESGRRQAWPFLTLADPSSSREVRLYIDTTFSVEPQWPQVDQDDDAAFLALASLDSSPITGVNSSGQGLTIEFSTQVLQIQGDGNHLTSHSPWWIGSQAT
jgi:hypothetical protein